MTTRPSGSHFAGAALIVCSTTTAVLLALVNAAGAAIVPTVPLATSGSYAVLGASTVTNTGNSTLDGSLGLWPGGSITGFPPGLVLPPGTTDADNAVAQQAQSDLTVAYGDAAGRPVDATTTADLANLTLQAGVYAGPDRSPLSLSGPLVLDGAGNLDSVFIFQTDSTLITGSASTVRLVNGAQECNVFWQVGSSATLGSGSVFSGNILALTSITVNNSVTVHGRALARNGAVTLDNDTFTRPTCERSSGTTTTTVAPVTTTTTTTTTTTPAGGPTPTTVPGTQGGSGTATGTGTTGSDDSSGPGAPGDGVPLRTTFTETGLTSGGPARPGGPGGPGVPRIVGPPRTGVAPSENGPSPWSAVLLTVVGAATVSAVRRRRARPMGC